MYNLTNTCIGLQLEDLKDTADHSLSSIFDDNQISDLPFLASSPLLHSSEFDDEHVSPGVSPLLNEASSGSEDGTQCVQLMDLDNPELTIPVQPESNALQWCGFKIVGDNIYKTVHQSVPMN